MLPESFEALAGALELSRMLSCRSFAMLNLTLWMKVLPSICRNTPFEVELTKSARNFFSGRSQCDENALSFTA